MKQKPLDFSQPGAEIGMILLVLGIIGFVIWSYITVNEMWVSQRASGLYLFAASSVLLFSASCFIFNYMRQTEIIESQDSSDLPEWIVLKQDSKRVLPPLCQRCGAPSRWAIEFDSWYCDRCNFFATTDS